MKTPPTREDLVRERGALMASRDRAYEALNRPLYEALTASIARIDALLSLSDAQAELLADKLLTLEWGPGVDAYRTVADLVRRSA